MTLPMMRCLIVCVTLALFSSAARGQGNRKGIDFFEAKIRPMLVTHCYSCHSAGAAAKKNLKGGLFLDSREGVLKGGESGPAIVVGKPDESMLISALKHDSFKMPPKGKLPDEIVGHFEQWIKMGAPDPRTGGTVASSNQIDINAGREHWSFQPLGPVAPPHVNDNNWIRNPIDRFIRARQEAKQITPNKLAVPRTLIRRLHYDLVGLPPTERAVSEFEAACKKDFEKAYRELVDQLLANKQFGERWARHWLDIVRFAESNGYAFDGDRPHAWRYRDFVIQALNDDMPYDRFVQLQVAGDLLTQTNVKTTPQSEEAIHYLAATGFLVAGPYTTQQTQKERERSRYEQLDDIISTIGTSFLGLTVGCSRCHDHKFDPLPQFDYYRLASCFSDVGFTNAAVNRSPETFLKATDTYQKGLNPLVAARTDFEKKQLSAEFEKWLAAKPENAAKAKALSGVSVEPWHYLGPFSAESFDKAYDQAFAPEKTLAKIDLKLGHGKLKWTAHPEWKDATIHNPFQGDNSAHYIYREVSSDGAKKIKLSLGKDDAIKAWCNGKSILAKKSSGGVAANEELLEVEAKKGKNSLLIKIVNGVGPSGFYFAMEAAKSLEGIRFADWYHAGPFQGKSFDESYAAIYGPEEKIDLKQTFEEGKVKWVAQPNWKDGSAHNDKLKGNHCANYLYRTVESDQDQVVTLNLGSDDGIKVWVNGRLVVNKKVARNNAAANQEKAAVQFAKGRNEILMKIINGGGATGFYFSAARADRPKDVSDILKIEKAKRNAKQKQRLVDWHKGYNLPWLKLNHAVLRQEAKKPVADLANVFSARVKGTTYQFGEDTYKVYHLRRGNADNKTDLAKPGFLNVLMTSGDQEKTWLTKSGEKETTPSRLALADWLTSVNKGAGHLLARVIVNRLWHHHFGSGIVATPSDFGTRGEKPSHPELLDWLAAELIQNGWRLKPIHRMIVTSSTYMQNGRITESGKKADPQNLLLWRRSSRRLEAEVIRDALLSVSGNLQFDMYGKGSLDQRLPRRSIYLTVKRSQLIPLLQLFDAPGTMQGIATREQSTVAPQALAMLNSPIIRDWATKFAQRARPNKETTLEQTIDRAYRIALSRPATDKEKHSMLAFIHQQKKSREKNANAETLAVRDFCHLVLCMNEFVYID